MGMVPARACAPCLSARALHSQHMRATPLSFHPSSLRQHGRDVEMAHAAAVPCEHLVVPPHEPLLAGHLAQDAREAKGGGVTVVDDAAVAAPPPTDALVRAHSVAHHAKQADG